MSNLTWYIFRTEPQREFAAEEALGRAGLAAMVPREYTSQIRRHGPRREARLKRQPRMSGYILVGFDGPVNWFRLFDQREGFGGTVFSVLGRNGIPAEVPPAVMSKIQRDNSELSPSGSGRKNFAVGYEATITHGAHAGYSGKVVDIKGDLVSFVQPWLGSDRLFTTTLDKVAAA